MKNDISKLFQQDPKLFEVTATPTSYVYKVNIDEACEHVSQFADLVDALEQAGEQDVFQIRLTTPGGSLDSVYPLISAMRNTDAFIHVHCDSMVASAGTLLMMCAHAVSFNEFISVMFHSVQGGSYGHQRNVDAQTAHFSATHDRLLRDLYKDFLTEDELEKLFFGMEYWFTPEECHERLKARHEKQQQEVTEEELIEQFLKGNPDIVEQATPKPKKEKRIKVPSTKKSVVE